MADAKAVWDNTGMSSSSERRHEDRERSRVWREWLMSFGEGADRKAKVLFLASTLLALCIWGLQLIGVAINLWLGGFVLTVVFSLGVYLLWIWEGFSSFRFALRTISVACTALLYFGLVGKQMYKEYILEHPLEFVSPAPPPMPTAPEPPQSMWQIPRIVPERKTPHLSMRLVKLINSDGFAIILIAAGSLVKSPSYIAAIWNLDRDTGDTLPMVHDSLDGSWIRPGEALGPYPLTSLPLVAPLIHAGNRLFGCITVTCPDCARSKAYWVYAIHGGAGWYSQLAPGTFCDLRALLRTLPAIRTNPEAFLHSIPDAERTQISE
jgi:hypothetical protein